MLQSVGLGGDGDEIQAIADVEQAFGVKLDYTHASDWLTAGDVFEALRTAIPAIERSKAELWDRFAAALCGISGVNPAVIEPASPLLSDNRFWARLADMSAFVWIASAVGLASVVGALFLRG